ncbi:hypothetical protein [Hyphobacterium sp.]|uniref:hypothetical protein n=1 Tax=Hyphobacterium sp. TaxID=2004662 RepID=UPI003B525645
MDNINKLQRKRDRAFMFAGVSFLLWQGATLGIDAADALSWSLPAGRLALQMALIAGAVAWAGSMILLLNYQRSVKRAGACSVLQDELFLQNRARATMYGFAGMIAGAALLLAAATFVDFSAAIAIRALLIIGVFIPLTVLARLGHEPDEEPA